MKIENTPRIVCSIGRAAVSVSPHEREKLILEHMVIVDRIVGVFKRKGLPSYIEADDLKQVGYLALIRTIDNRASKTVPTNARIAAHVERDVVRAIEREVRNWDPLFGFRENYDKGTEMADDAYTDERIHRNSFD